MHLKKIPLSIILLTLSTICSPSTIQASYHNPLPTLLIIVIPKKTQPPIYTLQTPPFNPSILVQPTETNMSRTSTTKIIAQPPQTHSPIPPYNHQQLNRSTPPPLSMQVPLHVCNRCNAMYTSQKKRDEHRQTHKLIRPYACKWCSKKFTIKYSLLRHARNKHSDLLPIKCSHCNKAFFDQQSCENHNRQMHYQQRVLTPKLTGHTPSTLPQ